MDSLIIEACSATVSITSTLFLSFISELIRKECRLINIGKYPQDYSPYLNNGDDFDFVVIGAGSAGSVVASRLSEDPNTRVLLLEAGGLPSVFTEIPYLFLTTQKTHEDWQFKTQKSPNFCTGLVGGVCNWPRGKVIGGSGAINSMLYFRGDKRDYDEWASMGNTGWDFNSIEKYFKKFENVTDPILRSKPQYGKDGLVTISRQYNQPKLRKVFIDAIQELGLTHHDSEQPLGYFTAPTTIEDGQRCSSGKAFLTKIPKRSNLFIARHSFVTKILINLDGDAYGVEVVTIFGKKKIFINKEVILSAGTVNSPKILMNSGVGPSQHLQNLGIPIKKNLPVGENLQDQLVTPHFLLKVPEDLISTRNIAVEATDYFLDREGLLSSVDITNFAGFINSKNQSNRPDLQVLHFLHTKDDDLGILILARAFGFAPETIASELVNTHLTPILRASANIIAPKSRGKILLKSANPFDDPLIFPGYFSDFGNEDFDTMLRGMWYLSNFSNTLALRSVGVKILRVDIPGCDINAPDEEYFKCLIRTTVSTLYNPVGTCKMAPVGDTTGVVDPRLRVQGVGKLRVIDASVMPVMVRTNTYGATLMIGEKGADMIKEDWGL